MATAPPPPPAALPEGRDVRLPWHLTLPAGLEQEFRHQARGILQQLIPTATLLMLLLHALATLVEYRLDPALLDNSWRPRLASLLATLGVAATCWRWPERLFPAVCGMALILTLSQLWLAQTVPHPLASGYFFACLLAILSLSTLYRLPLVWALPTGLLCCLLLVAVLLTGADPALASVALGFVGSGGLMCLTGHYTAERLERQAFLSEQVLHQHRRELHVANRSLESEATQDGLTGAVNRRGLDLRLAQMMHGMREQTRGAPDSVSVLIFDVDHFKQYNDTYGHQQGDLCLKAVAAVPQEMVQRADDFVARYGGEEFVVVLAGTRLADALVFAERLRARIEQLGLPHAGSRTNTVVTISIGVASTRQGQLTCDALIAQADQALYQAKEGGRNRVACWEESGRIRVIER